MTATYKIGVIGAGARGEGFARQLYAGHPRASLFGVCDIDGDRLQKFCDYCQLTGARTFTDTREFLQQQDLDAVVITTPEFAHAEVAVAAMEAGKHVYLEKPLANTVENCYRVMRAQQQTGKVAYVGFNLRAGAAYQKLHEIVQSGVLGQITFVSGMEQLHQAHGAAFMRRFHRKSAQSGGLLNHKCSHDLDIIQWIIGHQHKVTKVVSFGGCDVFTPNKQPATHCHLCPPDIYNACAYKAQAGFVFPVRGPEPIYMTSKQDIYGGDLCVYTSDKDIVDNQTVMMEWDNGIRGSFSLQMFQNRGMRRTSVWGEKGMVELGVFDNATIRLRLSDSGDVIDYNFQPRAGGHGGTDPSMVGRFIHAIETGDAQESGLQAGLAATMVAVKADQSMRTGQIVSIDPGEYEQQSAKEATRAARH